VISLQDKSEGLLTREHLLERFGCLERWYEVRLRLYITDNRGAVYHDVPFGYDNFLYFLKRQGFVDIQGGVDLGEEHTKLARLVDLPSRRGDVDGIFLHNSLCLSGSPSIRTAL